MTIQVKAFNYDDYSKGDWKVGMFKDNTLITIAFTENIDVDKTFLYKELWKKYIELTTTSNKTLFSFGCENNSFAKLL